MEFSISAKQEDMAEGIVRFCRRELNAGAAQRDREEHFDGGLFRKCGDMGLAGLPIPGDFGGSGLDSLSTALLLEAFGYGCRDGGLIFSLGAHLCACAVPLWKFGSAAQRQRYLAALAGGRCIGANAVSETEAGSDCLAMRTRAERDGHGYRISGVKSFVTNAPVAGLFVVYARSGQGSRLAGGISAFLVEAGTPGLRVGQRYSQMGLRSAPIAELVLEDVRVGTDAVLGGAGAGLPVFMLSMNWERACLFAAQVGTVARLLETALEHARSRRQFGQPIGKFQAVSHRLADLKVQLEASRLLCYRAAWTLENGKDALLRSAMAKLAASETLLQSALAAVQTLGASGFMCELEVERALRDAVAAGIYSGTSDIQRNMIARWLGL